MFRDGSRSRQGGVLCRRGPGRPQEDCRSLPGKWIFAITLGCEDADNHDTLYIMQLFDLVSEMKVVVELSHLVVGRKMHLPPAVYNRAIFGRVLQRTAGLQGRVATAQHNQVSMDHPDSRNDVAGFFGCWERGMRHWLASAGPDTPSTSFASWARHPKLPTA